MAGHTDWLEAIAGTMHCGSCGATFGRGDLDVARRQFDRWVVRCRCHVCGRDGLAVVLVEAAGRRGTTSGPGQTPLTADDVLDAHDLMRDESRAVQELLTAWGR